MKRLSIQELYKIGNSLEGKRKKEWDDLQKKHPTTSFLVWREVCDRQSEFFSEFAGCKCGASLKIQMQEIVDICEEFVDGDFAAAEKALEENNELKIFLQEHISQYKRNHQCHFNFESLICYCDEHGQHTI